PLAIRSGTYLAGSASPHQYEYVKQSISTNAPRIGIGAARSGADYYATELFPVCDASAPCNLGNSTTAIPNDWGQRRNGSGWNNGGSMSQTLFDPVDKPAWQKA